jgi:hypothetical protein
LPGPIAPKSERDDAQIIAIFDHYLELADPRRGDHKMTRCLNQVAALLTCNAALLFAGLLWNWAVNPTRGVLEQLDFTEYQQNALRG